MSPAQRSREGRAVGDIEGLVATLFAVADRHPEVAEAARIRVCARVFEAQVAAAVQADRKALTEPVAKAIYQQWHYQDGFVPWRDHGNSDRQTDARRLALRTLERSDTSALAAALAKARAEGMEAAAVIADMEARQDQTGCNPALMAPRIAAAIRAQSKGDGA